MKLKQFTDATVKRTINYEWETFDEETNENKQNVFELEIWFRKNLLNVRKAQELRSLLAENETAGTEAMIEFLCSAVARWNLEDEINLTTFNESLPPDLMALILETFSALLNAENPTKSKNSQGVLAQGAM